MLPSTAMTLLRADPTTFLQTNGLTIDGGPANGDTVYCFGHSDQAHAWAAGVGGPNEVWKAGDAAAGGMGITETMMTGLRLQPAFNLQMIPNTTAVAYNAILHGHLTGAGADMMFTGTLTGCTIIIVANAARTDVRIAHLRPGGLRGGAFSEQERIRGSGQLNGQGATHLFGPSDYYHGTCGSNVMGIRVGGAWEIYAQVFVRNPRSVREVQRVL
ncbi:hypothetical protein DKT77_13140 [Meridianimarinicoccus roseus]|uniref:Uncharacterized protein n=1 Tax=Meridianimarinicoccus roseus TaxID=2072018 RepID=A0A2V2LFC3_9RHOB|nr:hypothetical protein [Meridianimarinicoccus roseus]PWR02204.1 hypothetical protein DKT77_13140 [Meridianimarinicoccus roseus]